MNIVAARQKKSAFGTAVCEFSGLKTGKISIILSLFFIGMLLSSQLPAREKSYSFGVFPYLPPQKVELVWSTLASYISQQLRVPIRLRTRASYSSFKNEIENEYFDIAFMQPFVYANIASKHGYIPLARYVSLGDDQHKGMFKAIFVTLKENQDLKISDLKNKVIAMPPATSAVAILGQEFLLEHGLKAGKDYRISSHSNHNACLRQLIINRPVVCITAYPLYARFNKVTQNRLAIIASSRGIPSSVIAVHKRVVKKDRVAIKDILLNLKNNTSTQLFLERAQLSDFIATSDSDYKIVRDMWKSINR